MENSGKYFRRRASDHSPPYSRTWQSLAHKKESGKKASEYFERAFNVRHRALGSHPETEISLESYIEAMRKKGKRKRPKSYILITLYEGRTGQRTSPINFCQFRFTNILDSVPEFTPSYKNKYLPEDPIPLLINPRLDLAQTFFSSIARKRKDLYAEYFFFFIGQPNIQSIGNRIWINRKSIILIMMRSLYSKLRDDLL